MSDTYTIVTVDKSIDSTGAVAAVTVVLHNVTNTFGPYMLTITHAGDLAVKPGDTHALTLA